MSETGQSLDHLYRLVDQFLPTIGADRTEALRVIDQITRRITDGNDAKREAQQQVDALTAELAEVKAGYQALDKNWETIHEAAMGPIRSALDLPDGSVLEIVTAIETLKQAHTNPHVCEPVGGNDCRYCKHCGKDMPLTT